MKASGLLILFGLLLVGVVSGARDVQQGAQALLNCVQSNPGATDARLKLVDDWISGNCYAQCLMKALGVITSDGSSVNVSVNSSTFLN
jgi:hypothetical protein